MKKKPASSTQVRIDAGLSKEIDMLRSGFGVRTSRAAFVESLLRKGIAAEKASMRMDPMEVDGCRLSKKGLDPAESAFKK